MTCECQRLIPGPTGSMIRDQGERNFALIDEFFVGRVLPVDEMNNVPMTYAQKLMYLPVDKKVDREIDRHFAKPVKVKKLLRRVK